MCKARDIAISMVNRSVDLSEGSGLNYYMDFVKLHKLLYLGQCYMFSTYKKPLFEDKIYAHHCGPYVDNIHFIPAYYGYAPITEHISSENLSRLSMFRIDAIETILQRYGTKSTDELIALTKSTDPYKKVEAEVSDDNKAEITIESISEYKLPSPE